MDEKLTIRRHTDEREVDWGKAPIATWALNHCTDLAKARAKRRLKFEEMKKSWKAKQNEPT